MNKIISSIAAVAFLLATVVVTPAQAADMAVDFMTIVMSSQTASQANGVTYTFASRVNGASSIDANSETIVLTFETAPGNLASITNANVTLKVNTDDINGTGGTAQTVAAAVADGQWTISNTATALTLVAPQNAATVPIALTDDKYIYVQVSNLGTPAAGDTMVSMSGTALGSNTYKGAFLTSAANTISVSASVDPTLSMSLANTTVNLGTLTTGAISESSTDPTVTVATNGTSGVTISVLDADGNVGLRSTTASKTIAATANNATVLGSEGFDIQVTQTTDPQGNGSVTAAFAPNGVGILTASAQSIASTSGPTSGYVATVNIRAAISATTPAASDYTTTLTFVTTGTF